MVTGQHACREASGVHIGIMLGASDVADRLGYSWENFELWGSGGDLGTVIGHLGAEK